MFCDGYQESVGKDNATGIMQCMEKVQIWNKDNVKGQFRYLLDPSFPICIPFNPTLHGGGHSVPPHYGFGLLSLPELSERPQMLAQFI